MPRFGRFFLPGPTEVRPEIARAMTQPMIAHRGPEFRELFERLQSGLRYVFRTTRPVFISTSSATGLMEAGVRCAPQGRMLALVNGAFSARFADIAALTGRECDRYEVPAGEVHDPDELGRRLVAQRYAVITIVHCETSTGALNDVQALARVAREHDVPCVVDSVSGIAGTGFHFDEWGLDFALTGSQKALALPPGLAFGVATPAFVAGAAAAPQRGMYFDLLEHEAMAARSETPNTPALPLLFALDAQLQAIRHEGLDARWERHVKMQECTEAWVENLRSEHGLDVAITVRPGYRSPTVTSVRLPPGVSGNELVKRVAEQGYVVGTGYRALGDGSFRVGHMGDHTVPRLRECLGACEDVLLGMVNR
ncbi:MAG TPA: alanine--glyoxylate aminotransferase family protein [Gemmatimonadaceae bacterium]